MWSAVRYAKVYKICTGTNTLLGKIMLKPDCELFFLTSKTNSVVIAKLNVYDEGGIKRLTKEQQNPIHVQSVWMRMHGRSVMDFTLFGAS